MNGENLQIDKFNVILRSPAFNGLFKNAEISCGIGWLKIIEEAYQNIQLLILKKGLTSDHKDWPTITTVKEKFGELRLYVDTTSVELYKEIQIILDQAAKRSKETCDCCGEKGVLMMINTTAATRCHQHRKI